MKILVFGFSVTAEAAGYVERWSSENGSLYPELTISKVGLGGLQPFSVRHLLGGILDRNNPDVLIVEIATAATRGLPVLQERIEDHQDTVKAIFSECRCRGIKCGFLDLPLSGVNPKNDWMAKVHWQMCAQYNVPRSVVEYQEGTLRDNVHPNDAGKAIYAGAFGSLLSDVLEAKCSFDGLSGERQFGAFTVDMLEVDGGARREFSRAGLFVPAISIPAGETVTITLPEEVVVSGVLALMGPQTGFMEIELAGKSQSVCFYDPHCYYERVGGRRIDPAVTSKISFTQTEEVPTVELIKGEKNTSSRIGGLTHILYELQQAEAKDAF